jgi:hypothetical protein
MIANARHLILYSGCYTGYCTAHNYGLVPNLHVVRARKVLIRFIFFLPCKYKSTFSDWISFLAYPNLFGIKGFLVVVVVVVVSTNQLSSLVSATALSVKECWAMRCIQVFAYLLLCNQSILTQR